LPGIKARPWTFTLKGKALNFFCVVASTCIPLLQATKHQANSSSPPRLEPPLLDHRSWLPYHSPPTSRNENVLHDIKSQPSFETLPLKPNGQTKARVRTTEYHLIHQSPGMRRPVEFTGGAFRNTTVQPEEIHLDARRNPRTTSFIQNKQGAPHVTHR
jgi:hypothetical protein